MASKCQHTNKPHYSSGLCQSCYLAQYYQKRKKKMLEKEMLHVNKKKSDSEDKVSHKSKNSVAVDPINSDEGH